MSDGLKVLFIAFSILITLFIASFGVNYFMKQKEIIERGHVLIDKVTVSYHNINYISFDRDDLYYSDVKKLFNLVVFDNKTKKNSIYGIEMIIFNNGHDENLGYITDTDFMVNYQFLDPNSFERGKMFKAEMIYNDYGIISKIRVICNL